MTHPGTPGNSPGRRPAAAPARAGERPGDKREFSPFYREHITRLIAYLIYQGAAAHLAADFAQDAMITAYRRWADVTSPRAYVYTVAYKAFLRYATDAREQSVGEVPEPAAVLPRPEEAEAWLQQQQVMQILRALPPRQRQVFALTIDGWTPTEIADMLGIDPAAVRASLKKARRNADEHRRAGEEAP